MKSPAPAIARSRSSTSARSPGFAAQASFRNADRSVRRFDLQGPAEDRFHVGGGGVHRLVLRFGMQDHLTNPVRRPGRITASGTEDFGVQPPSGSSPPRDRNSQARA